MKYVDIHGHVNFDDYDADRAEVIDRAREAGVGMIAVGADPQSSLQAVELAEKYDGVYATIGIHPTHLDHSSEEVDLDPFRKLLQNDKKGKIVAIGECGLDYFHLDESSVPAQKAGFEAMIDLANESRKPLMLHVRNGGSRQGGKSSTLISGNNAGTTRSAYRDAYEIIRNRAKVLGNLHFFAGSIEEAKIFLDIGYSFSFTGVITFTTDYDEIVRHIPLERTMSETDCPWVSPIPYRGRRNEPLYVVEVVKAIARIKGMEDHEVAERLMGNAMKFFGLKV